MQRSMWSPLCRAWLGEAKDDAQGSRLAPLTCARSNRRLLGERWSVRCSVSAVGLRVVLRGQGCRRQYVFFIVFRIFSVSKSDTSLLASVTIPS